MAATVVSCGILVIDAQAELLMCHASGTSRWDIPKGIADDGEDEQQAALRETHEETGLQLDAERLLDLGRHAYRRGKDLHLYAALIERIDATRCVCSTSFRDAHGRERPEMDAVEWVPFARVTLRCGRSLAALLTQKVPLASVWMRLMADDAAAAG